MYFQKQKEGESAVLLRYHIQFPDYINFNRHRPSSPMATKYFKDLTKYVCIF